jgi:AraC family transcriptional regulator, transcriptional activator of pobA
VLPAMNDENLILSEIKRAIRKFANADLVNLDDHFSHKFQFQVFRFEDLLSNTNRTIPPNKWSYHRIGLITEGSGEFVTGIYKYRAEKNTLVVIPAGVITSSKSWTTDTKGFLVLFNMDFFLQSNLPRQYIESKKILTPSIRPFIYLTDQQARDAEEIFETILRENKNAHPHKDELIALKMIELLILSERLFAEKQQLESSVPVADIIKRFIDLLEIHFMKERSVGFYASQLNVHPNHLNALVKKHTGLTAKESIQQRLLLETKYLLHSTKLSIKEISNRVGFHDPNYFAVFFKRLEQVSPGSYRSAFV